MTAEHFSVPLVNRLALPSTQQMPQGYYRSKLFITPFSANPLVAAAGPLLSLLERLCISPSLPPVTSIRDNIAHELHAFHSQLTSKTSSEELTAIAHYLLCATIDELLGKSYMRLFGEVVNFNAFTPPTHDQTGPQKRFFDIVTFLKENPNRYLDLLELTYYCLITGFEGEQHGRPDGRQVLDNLIEELYQLIQQHRVYKSPQLFSQQKSIERTTKNHKPLILVGCLALSILIFGYFTSHVLLENQAKTLQFGHSVTAILDN